MVQKCGITLCKHDTIQVQITVLKVVQHVERNITIIHERGAKQNAKNGADVMVQKHGTKQSINDGELRA